MGQNVKLTPALRKIQTNREQKSLQCTESRMKVHNQPRNTMNRILGPPGIIHLLQFNLMLKYMISPCNKLSQPSPLINSQRSLALASNRSV